MRIKSKFGTDGNGAVEGATGDRDGLPANRPRALILHPEDPEELGGPLSDRTFIVDPKIGLELNGLPDSELWVVELIQKGDGPDSQLPTILAPIEENPALS